MKLNFEHKAVTSAINKKSKNNSKIGGGRKIRRNPSRQIPKWGDFEKEKKKKSNRLLKNKCAQRENKERNTRTKKNKAQNFLQSTQTKSKHPSLTW